MTRASAIDALVRKFTNYRNSRKKTTDENRASEDTDALKAAAAALVDLKTYSKGRNLFKERNNAEILAKRDLLMEENPKLSRVGAFQKALKELWHDADQEFWDAQATSEADDIYEYVNCVTQTIFQLLTPISRNQKLFPDHLYASMRGICRVGGLGDAVLMAFYAFRGHSGQIESGM